MNYINNKTMEYFLSHGDVDIKDMATKLLDDMYAYCAILAKSKTIDFYSGDLDTIKSYDTSRRIRHDCVISGINKFNRLAGNEKVDLLLDTSNMTREDISNAVALYCTLGSSEDEDGRALDDIIKQLK